MAFPSPKLSIFFLHFNKEAEDGLLINFDWLLIYPNSKLEIKHTLTQSHTHALVHISHMHIYIYPLLPFYMSPFLQFHIRKMQGWWVEGCLQRGANGIHTCFALLGIAAIKNISQVFRYLRVAWYQNWHPLKNTRGNICMYDIVSSFNFLFLYGNLWVKGV